MSNTHYLACVSVLALLTASPALAQGSQEGREGGSTLSEVIVTAQKREQSLQDVSASISAVTGDALQDAGVASVQDLQALVPNITIGTSFGYANLFVRGLGLNSVFANVDPSVTLYEDGAVISQPAAQLFSFFDLERVEVLRGPQGTLYGRNATGGTINLITAKPTRELTGFARVNVGNYASIESEGAVSGPINGVLSGRLSYLHSSRDGFGKNVITGTDVNDLDTRAVRAQLAFEPNERFNILLSAEYGRENDKANALQFDRETFPGVLTDSIPANNGLAAPGAGGFPAGDPRDYASDADPFNHRETWSVTATVRWELNDVVTLTNLVNYRDFTMDMSQDLDLSATVTSSIQDFLFDSQQFSEELQVNITTDRLQAVGGLYYFKEDLFHQNAIGLRAKVGEFPTNTPGSGRRVYLLGWGETETWAAYWNASYKLSDQFTVRAGGRYTSDSRSINNENWIWVPGAGGALPTPPLAQVPRVQSYNGSLDDNRSFNDYTNEAGIEWRPTDNIMAYYTYSEGFKAGTGQLGTTQPVRPLIIRPETISNHEVGIKSTFSNFLFNASLYKYRIRNIQLDRTLPGGPSGFETIFENASYQDGKGLEIDAQWRPTEVFRANLSLVLQKTEFGPFLTVNPTNPLLYLGRVPDPSNPSGPGLPHPLLVEDIQGNPARNAPEVAANLSVEYDIPVSGGLITLAGSASYKGRQYFSEFKEPLLSQKGYAVFDGSVRYAFPNQRWDASLWVKNITDEEAKSAAFALATGRVIGRTFIPPRTFGASVRVSF